MSARQPNPSVGGCCGVSATADPELIRQLAAHLPCQEPLPVPIAASGSPSLLGLTIDRNRRSVEPTSPVEQIGELGNRHAGRRLAPRRRDRGQRLSVLTPAACCARWRAGTARRCSSTASDTGATAAGPAGARAGATASGGRPAASGAAGAAPGSGGSGRSCRAGRSTANRRTWATWTTSTGRTPGG